MFNGLSPPYAAMILLELHQNASGDYSVRLFYKNSTVDSDVLLDLAIPGKGVSYVHFVIHYSF